MLDYILDNLLKDNIEKITLYSEINRDGEREKIEYENVKCYIQDSQKVKYTDKARVITINAYIYVKGDLFNGHNILDGNVLIDGREYRINAGRKYRDTFSNEVVYTKLEVV